jgi:tetratricopeptide (TPR) repeat protein
MHSERDTDTRTSGGQQRLQRSGIWRAGKLWGEYRASRGPRDDYLELHVQHGRFPGRRLQRVRARACDVSVRCSDGGRRLAVLRLTTAEQSADQRDWLRELAGLLLPALPTLQLDPASEPSARRTAGAGTSDEPAGPASASEAATAEAAAEEHEPCLPRAVSALEQGRLGTAEHVGQQARAAGEDGASEFLDALRAIRRGAKLVQRWPRDAPAHLALAQAYFLADAGTAALREAGEALRLDPALGEAHALVGLEAAYRGDRDGAAAAWEQARMLAPAGEWQQALGRLLARAAIGSGTPATQPLPEGGPLWSATVRTLLHRLRRLVSMSETDSPEHQP